MIQEKIEKLIKERIELDPQNEVLLHEKWDEETSLIISNMDEAISYIKNTASEEMLYWISEVLYSIIKASNNMDFLDAYKFRLNDIHNADWKESIAYEINFVGDGF